MKLLFIYIKKYKKILFGALALATVNQVFSLLEPQIFRLIIDNYATKFQELTRNEFIRGVVVLLLASMGAALISRIAKNFQDYYVNVITQRVGTDLYAKSVDHSFSLPFAVFEDQRSGELLQKLQKARTDSQSLITGSIGILFLSFVGIAFVLTYAFIVHWSIGLIYFLLIPVLGISTFVISSRIKEAQKHVVKESAELAGSTTETLRNVELVKSLGLESQETNRLNDVNEKILELELKKVRLIRTLGFIQGTLVNAMRSGVLLLMLWLIFRGTISLGEFFSLWIYSFFIFNPLAEFGTVAAQYQEARASMEELAGVLNTKPELKPSSPKEVGHLTSVSFESVSFTYQTTDNPSVRDISMQIDPGKTIALVGPSGSGKSTLIKLLVGLYKPSSGKLKFNDIGSSEIDLDELRRHIGYVSQETQLFAGTVRENLLFVNPDASDEECLNAIKAASVTDVIERGGKGLDTKIGEGGIKISGGERQRLAIARALLRKPDLIIFDEATSSLDSITEKAITKTIQEIVNSQKNLMTVLVAHRLSTVAHADMIYVLEKGKIIEQGSHEKLLDVKGLYAALWREQAAVNHTNPRA